jgi:hypothetical protein
VEPRCGRLARTEMYKLLKPLDNVVLTPICECFAREHGAEFLTIHPDN